MLVVTLNNPVHHHWYLQGPNPISYHGPRGLCASLMFWKLPSFCTCEILISKGSSPGLTDNVDTYCTLFWAILDGDSCIRQKMGEKWACKDDGMLASYTQHTEIANWLLGNDQFCQFLPAVAPWLIGERATEPWVYETTVRVKPTQELLELFGVQQKHRLQTSKIIVASKI